MIKHGVARPFLLAVEVLHPKWKSSRACKTRVRAPQAQFVKLDIANWAPEDQPDLIFANAALQFLPEHERLFPRLMSYLAPGGALAAQMPNIANESSHALMRMVAAEGPWSSRLVPIAKTQPLIAGYEDYYDWLRPQASRVDVCSAGFEGLMNASAHFN